MSKKKQVKPKWFDGVVYKEGATVTNPFSGESYKLNALELSIYDFVMGANMLIEESFHNKVEPDDRLERITRDLYKGIDWFKDNNVKAYMILLD